MSKAIGESGPVLTGPDTEQWRRLLPLFREINDLKRVRAPGVMPSIAGVRFRQAAALLFHSQVVADSVEWHAIAIRLMRDLVAGTRLAAISTDDLRAGGMDSATARSIFQLAIEERRGILEPHLFDALLAAPDREADSAEQQDAIGELAADGQGSWIERLINQPRAGATAPGQARIVLEPVESCAEHCLVTAVYAGLLAPSFGASIDDAFAIGVAHHLHNARLPDAGFAGEALIGEHLGELLTTLRNAVLAQMAPDAARRLEPLLFEIDAVDTPLARAFHTADTIDRVLQIEYFARCNQFRLETAMVDMELVHAGPVQAFQYQQLEMAGLRW